MAAGFSSPYSGRGDFAITNGVPPPPKPTNAITGSYNLYNQGVKQQAEDYSGIMQGYKDLYNKALAMPQMSTPSPVSAQTYSSQDYNYKPTASTTSSIANLADLASTGGYSAQGIADLRARGISPIRAIYANAQRNVDRQKAIQGGYSPNYAAVSAKMAREMSDQIAGAVQNVNAGIAQNVAGNRISAASPYASAAGAENALSANMGRSNVDARNQASQFNAGAANDMSRFNATLPLEYAKFNQGGSNLALQALEGQRGLYGTTPALSALFGQQALQSAGLQNQINNQGLGAQVQLANNYGYR